MNTSLPRSTRSTNILIRVTLDKSSTQQQKRDNRRCVRLLRFYLPPRDLAPRHGSYQQTKSELKRTTTSTIDCTALHDQAAMAQACRSCVACCSHQVELRRTGKDCLLSTSSSAHVVATPASLRASHMYSASSSKVTLSIARLQWPSAYSIRA